METPQGELSFVNAAEQFDPSDGCLAIKVLEAEHRSGSGFDSAVILFYQILQMLRPSPLCVLPCIVFPWHLLHGWVWCSVAILV
jgi:hypothetical protein